MKRREFITLFGSAAAAWPLVARAQQPKMPLVGYLSAGSREDDGFRLTAIRQGLADAGYVEGANVALEYRWADKQPARLPELAAELIHRSVDVIVLGSTATTRVAKKATATIPIVFVMAGDPVKFDLVASINRPGGNVTGVSYLGIGLLAKRMAMLHEMVPSATSVGFLINPTNPNAEANTSDARSSAAALGQTLIVANAGSDDEMERVFAGFVQARVGALFVDDDPLFNGRAARLATLAALNALPAMYPLPEYVSAGGLMSYGSSLSDSYRQAGIYTGRILKGEKPADMPVMQPTKLDLVINLRTAKTLGLQIPDKVLALADKVIE
jgi:putative ABC transport system substrate-binding protein